jgi:hypothetical protein
MRYIIILTSIIIFICSCNNKANVSINTIKADLNTFDKVSIYDLFQKIEIIKLETDSSALISYFKKVITFDNKYYILDFRSHEIFIYSDNGEFMNKISNIGEGPNEYYQISDFEIDTTSQTLVIIDPINSVLLKYDLCGTFKKRQSLPILERSYYSLKFVSSDIILFWTFDYTNRAKFFSLSENEILSETFPEADNILNDFDLLFPYGNFLCRPISNTVFEYTVDCEITESYKWDFGILNNDEKKVAKANDLLSKMSEDVLMKKMLSSEIVNYIFANQGGNSKYKMAQLFRNNKILNVLYNIETKKSIVFDKTIENARFFPIYWTDDFIIGKKLETETSLDGCLPDEILDAKAKLMKSQINEMDNPILIKYHFRR